MEPYNPNKPWLSVNLPSREELIAMAMGLIPGGRALKYYHDNPEGSVIETLKLAAEDVILFYGTYRNDGDISDYAKEAVMLGVPMPYIKHPKTGAPIPNNLKEALGKDGWANTKSNWKNNKPAARKLYAEPMESRRKLGITEGRMSTRSRVNTTAEARTPVDVPAGPYQATNTGSNLVNQGQQLMNTNTVRTGGRSGKLKGTNVWQGDMYPPGRSLARLEEYGPYVWDKATDQREYIRKLNDVINENENKWEYLINKTRTKLPEGSSPMARLRSSAIVPKEDIVSIALAQGRPDIAARVMADNEPRMATMAGSLNYNPRFNSYISNQRGSGIKDNAKWKDIGNRQVEKELREQFSQLPEDDLMRYKFADYYGVPDLYNDWKANPEYWKEFRKKTAARRHNRELSNRWADIQLGRQLEQ